MANSFIRYGVGVDLSKDCFHVCLKGLTEGDQEKIVASRKFDQTQSGFDSFKEWLLQKLKNSEAPCTILMEVTGVYHENLLYYLYESGFSVSLVQGARVKHYLKSQNFDSKTDKEDAEGMALMALRGRYRLWKPVSEQMHKIRQLVRYRNKLVATRVSYQNQLHALSHSRHVHQEVIGSAKKMIEQLKKDTRLIEKKITELVKSDEQLWKRVKTIIDSVYGIGFISLITILAETDGFSFITSAKQLTSYAGLNIVENSSGKITGKTKISKQGNARLRKALYTPATTLIRGKKGPLYSLYLRLFERNGKIWKKAQVAVQRKLLCLVYSLWKSGQSYDPDYHLKPKAAVTPLHDTQNQLLNA